MAIMSGGADCLPADEGVLPPGYEGGPPERRLNREKKSKSAGTEERLMKTLLISICAKDRVVS